MKTPEGVQLHVLNVLKQTNYFWYYLKGLERQCLLDLNDLSFLKTPK